LIKEEAEWKLQKNFQSTVILQNKFFSMIFFVVRQKYQTKIFYNFSLFQKGMGNLRFPQIHPFSHIENMPTIFFDKCPLLKTEMDRWIKQNNTVIVNGFLNDERAKIKFSKFLKILKLSVKCQTKKSKLKSSVLNRTIQNGFELPSLINSLAD